MTSLRPTTERFDLARFVRPRIRGNRNLAWRAAWYVTGALFFQSALLGLIPSPVKAAILRGFGARVGGGLVCKSRVTIKYPWFLSVGDNVWLGETAWIDNHCQVSIGSDTCISQGVCIYTGNHDWNDPAFGFRCAPVSIGEGVWVTAFQRLGPGTTVPSDCVVLDAPTAGSSRRRPADDPAPGPGRPAADLDPADTAAVRPRGRRLG